MVTTVPLIPSLFVKTDKKDIKWSEKIENLELQLNAVYWQAFISILLKSRNFNDFKNLLWKEKISRGTRNQVP